MIYVIVTYSDGHEDKTYFNIDIEADNYAIMLNNYHNLHLYDKSEDKIENLTKKYITQI